MLDAKADPLAYLAEALGRQQRIANAAGRPFLAYLIGIAALQAEEEAGTARVSVKVQSAARRLGGARASRSRL